MPAPIVPIVRRRPPDQPGPLDHLTPGDVMQRLYALNPDKADAIITLGRIFLLEELEKRDGCYT